MVIKWRADLRLCKILVNTGCFLDRLMSKVDPSLLDVGAVRLGAGRTSVPMVAS